MNDYYSAKETAASNANCVLPEAFGATDKTFQIPTHLVTIIRKLAKDLNNGAWMDQINTAMQGDIPSAKQMKTMLSGNINKFSTNDMIVAVAWFFRIDSYCYGQDTLSKRFLVSDMSTNCKADQITGHG